MESADAVVKAVTYNVMDHVVYVAVSLPRDGNSTVSDTIYTVKLGGSMELVAVVEDAGDVRGQLIVILARSSIYKYLLYMYTIHQGITQLHMSVCV